MSKLVDLTGQKFGRLTVVKRTDNDKWGHNLWVCRCGWSIEKSLNTPMQRKSVV